MSKPLLLVEALGTRNDSGLGRNARMLVESLRGLAGEAEIHVVLPSDGGYVPGPHCRIIRARARPLRPWIQAVFPLLIARLRPRLVLCLGQSLPRWRPFAAGAARYVLMVPDAAPLEDAPWPMSRHDAYNRAWLKANAARADRLLTISAFSQARLAALLALPRERIAVVHPIRGAPAGAAPGGAAPAAPAGGYFLAVGNVEPRKNYPGLLAAYARLRERRPDAPPLQIVGHKAWGWSEAEAALRRFRLEAHATFTDFLPEAELSARLRGCAAFISSSLYEGWGLPLFEALAQGKPALYHRGSSQEEFARGLALAVDCSDPERLAKGMESLLDAREREKWARAAAAGIPRLLAYDQEAALRAALLPLLAEP